MKVDITLWSYTKNDSIITSYGRSSQWWGGAIFSRLAIALSEIKYPQKVVIRRNKERSRQLRGNNVDVTEMRFGGALDFFDFLQTSKISY